MSYIPLESVESSMISKIGYDRKTQTLRVLFKNGTAYDYPTFSDRDWRAFREAESLGKHFHRAIRPTFGHSRVTEAQMREPCCDHPERDTCDESCGECDEFCCPCAREASAVMTREKALAILAQPHTGVAGMVQAGCNCDCGGCVLCAYRFLERATEPLEVVLVDACSDHPDGCSEGCPFEADKGPTVGEALSDAQRFREELEGNDLLEKEEDDDGTED